MAADWYYLSNQQQAGPVELEALKAMVRAGSPSPADLVFGPGLTEWTPVSQVPALGSGGGSGGGAAVIGYRGVETGNAGISPRAADMLRQTGPWVRFISVLMLIAAGLVLIGGVFALGAGAFMGSRAGGAIPGVVGVGYIVLGALYGVPALLLGRYASRIGALMRTNRMGDLEEALGAQKSFWKFVGVLMVVMLCVYAAVIVVLVFRGFR
jgi:hypothetical protein